MQLRRDGGAGDAEIKTETMKHLEAQDDCFALDVCLDYFQD